MPELLSRLTGFVVLSRSRYNGRMSRYHLSFFSLFLILVVVMTGCQFFSDDKKISADHARFERIVQAVETLRAAYEKQNLDAVRKLMLPLKGFQRLEGQIQRDFDTYSTISLSTSRLSESTFKGNASRSTCDGRENGNEFSPEETPVTDRGHGVWVWSGTKDMLLAGVEGAMPFGKAGR